MNVVGIRFRTEGALVVLQVCESKPARFNSYQQDDEWRDAKVEDLLDVSKFTETTIGRRLDQLASRLDSMEYQQVMRSAE